QAVDPRRERPAMQLGRTRIVRCVWVAVAQPGPAVLMEVAHHQVEATVGAGIDRGGQLVFIVDLTMALQPPRDQLTPAAWAWARLRLPHIGEHGHPAPR